MTPPDHLRTWSILAILVTIALAAAAAVGFYVAGQAYRGHTQAGPDGLAGGGTSAAPSPAVTASAVASAVPSRAGLPGELSAASLELAGRATVRLTAPDDSYGGSGSIISADGLVLTNAHVARPRAPGLAVAYAEPAEREPEDPPYVVVSVSPPGDGAVQARYRATVAAVDGYLDLAVLRIVATLDGLPVPGGTTFPFLPRGTVADLRKSDRLTVLGFPGLTGGDRLDVTDGSIRNLLPDRGGRVPAERYEMATTVDFAAGNSGGAAVDNAGRLVGVPSSRLTNARQETTGLVRPVDFAEPMVMAAEAGGPYLSPYVVASDGQESARDVGWSADPLDCSTGEGRADLSAEVAAVSSSVLLQGMAAGEDVLAEVRFDGDLVLSQPTVWEGDACLVTTLTAPDLSEVKGPSDTLSAGRYELRVYVGPTYRRVLSSPLELYP